MIFKDAILGQICQKFVFYGEIRRLKKRLGLRENKIFLGENKIFLGENKIFFLGWKVWIRMEKLAFTLLIS